MEPLRDGTVLRDRYRVEARVETGAHENLYRVRDQKFATDWAMREFDLSGLEPARRDEAIAAFDAEAARLAQLRHPGMAQVVDHYAEGDRAYVFTEFVNGRSWDALLASHGGRLPLDQIADLGAKLLDAIYFFHTSYDPFPIRSLGPGTVWVNDDDEIKIYEFGLGSHFQTGPVIFGTPGYIAPEHLAGAPPDLPLDIYAAGALLHQAATGVVPGQPPLASPRSLNPEVPPALDRVISKAVNPDPAQRHFDVGEFKHDLMAVAEGFAPDATPSAGATASTERPPLPASATAAPRGELVGSRRMGGCAPVVALVLALVTWLATFSR